MPVPHHFPSLVEGTDQAVIIAGTGLSAPDAPTIGILKENLDGVASDLGVVPNTDFYDLAEAILKKLDGNGKTDAESRLWLAEKLGMLDDRQWFGEVGLPLSGNTPRHRVLARFAVEGCLRAIVSLNWDALMEAALDSVGLVEGGSLPRPWKVTEYARVIDDTHMPLLAHQNVFPVIKPHGCVRELNRIRNQLLKGESLGLVIFKLTTSEFKILQPLQNTVVNNNVENYIAKCSLIGIGWKASEPYLRDTITNIAKKVKRTELDSFTLIDCEWNTKHTEIADAYGKSESESFAQVKVEENPTTDCLMQWLQARYALKKMIDMIPLNEQKFLMQLLKDIDQPVCEHPVLSWADCWLPTWVRLCWRAGAMQGVDPKTNKIIGPFDIPVTPFDAHIPLTGMSIERRDLHAAAKILDVLPKPLSRFRFDLYPGGILDTNNHYLYLPLPGWKSSEYASDLSALKPLIKALKGLGFTRKIVLLMLNNKNEMPDIKLRAQLGAQFKSLMPLAGYASEESLTWIDLDDMRGI